ncbi:MAG: PAS domain-containing protein [Planctomycetaceae bacterium]|nr:PAS domain-containing protein [Planctomycetaceae bacterium]
MSGQTRHQSQHEGWLECVRPKDRPEVMEGWYRAIEKRQYFEFSFRILHAGGKIRHVRSRGTQIAQAEHPCIGYIIWIEDASEHHLVAGERCEHTESLERSLNGIYIFDADTLGYEFVNEDARRNLGYDMCDLRKMTPVEIQPLFD